MMRSSRSTYNAKRKGKEIYEENSNTMDFAEFYAQRGNKGITICERSANSRSEEMARYLGTSNDHSNGQKLQSQDMISLNQVNPNYFLSKSIKEMSVLPRQHHKPRIIVHPSKIIGPSRFSQNYDQNTQRTSVSAPRDFSLMKLLLEEDNISTLTDEELLYAKELLSTGQGLLLEGQGVQQFPCSQVGNHQNIERASGPATSDFSYMKFLMEDDNSSVLTNDLYENQLLSTLCSLSSEGQMVQQWLSSQVGNYPFDKASEGQMVQQWPCSQVGNYPFENALAGQMVQQWPSSQVGNFLFDNALEGQMMQQWPCSQVGNYPFDNALEGQMVQQWPCSQVGNYPFDNALEGQMVQQWPCSQVGNYPFDNASVGQMMQQWPCSQVENYQFENSSVGQMMQQWPCSQVENYTFKNSLQQINLQNYENQVLQQPQQPSYMNVLKRDDISYMDLLTRDDISCGDMLTREEVSYKDLLTREDISWTFNA
ncbi:hypothetical protein MTR67_005097 [Solanum verrucosum]|uniref:Uncharacterized protein n=1 Tax=Solanum verrucosum TaxID=315347 RepID=A0AAF0PVP3_SOLVR|nr:hypothetical protein MTR67_005097 [Solanum verrucosum]